MGEGRGEGFIATMTRQFLFTAAALALCCLAGCGYVGQVKQATDRIEEMRPEIEQRNQELESLANPSAVPADPPAPAP
jgi:hypothetical protein